MKLLHLSLSLFLCLLLPLPPLAAQFSQDVRQDEQLLKLEKEVQQLKNSNYALILQVRELNGKLKQQMARVDSLTENMESRASQFDEKTAALGTRIQDTGNLANDRLNALREALSKNSVYLMLAFLLAIMMAISVFLLLRKRLLQNSSALDERISQTKKSLEEEGVKLDSKLADILDSQLKLWKLDREAALKAAESKPENPSTETDHSLALKVADEIIRIQQNINHMDTATRGLKQLTAAVRRIQDNFEANGYEIVDMMNKVYDPGLKALVNFKTDENLKSGEQKITRIIKPQINFNNEMIQMAQIEVSHGEK